MTKRNLLALLLWLSAANAYADHYWLAPVPWVDSTKDRPGHFAAPDGVTSWIDLRTMTERATGGAANGVALFVTPDDVTIKNVTLDLGDSLDKATDADERLAIKNALRLPSVPASQTIKGAIYEALTESADVKGETRCKPIMPTNQRRMEIVLGGEKIFDRQFDAAAADGAKVQEALRDQYRELKAAADAGKIPADQYLKVLDFWRETYKLPPEWFIPNDLPKEQPVKHSTSWSDDFNRGDGGIGASWTASGGTFSVESFGVRKSAATSAFNFCRYDSDLSSANHYSQAKVVVATEDGGWGPACRVGSDATGYCVYHYTGSAYLTACVSGTPTAIDVDGSPISSGGTLRVIADGSTITSTYNGGALSAATDTSITGNLRCGIFSYSTYGTATLDDWVASDLSAPAARRAFPQTIISAALDPRRWLYQETFFGISP